MEECIHELLRLVSFANQQRFSHVKLQCAELVDWFLSLVGFVPRQPVNIDRADKAAQAAVEIRAKLKEFGLTLPAPFKQQCFAMSDWARDESLSKAGIAVKDGTSTSTWKWK